MATQQQVYGGVIGNGVSVIAVAINPDGKLGATGSYDGTVRLWDDAGRQVGATLVGQAGAVWSVAFSPDGKTLATGNGNDTVQLRDVAAGQFYKYAVEEELLDHSPAALVRRPRLDYESHATALDRNELGALLVAAGLGPPPEHALISLLAPNGLRVSGATVLSI